MPNLAIIREQVAHEYRAWVLQPEYIEVLAQERFGAKLAAQIQKKELEEDIMEDTRNDYEELNEMDEAESVQDGIEQEREEFESQPEYWL